MSTSDTATSAAAGARSTASPGSAGPSSPRRRGRVNMPLVVGSVNGDERHIAAVIRRTDATWTPAVRLDAGLAGTPGRVAAAGNTDGDFAVSWTQFTTGSDSGTTYVSIRLQGGTWHRSVVGGLSDRSFGGEGPQPRTRVGIDAYGNVTVARTVTSAGSSTHRLLTRRKPVERRVAGTAPGVRRRPVRALARPGHRADRPRDSQLPARELGVAGLRRQLRAAPGERGRCARTGLAPAGLLAALDRSGRRPAPARVGDGQRHRSRPRLHPGFQPRGAARSRTLAVIPRTSRAWRWTSTALEWWLLVPATTSSSTPSPRRAWAPVSPCSPETTGRSRFIRLSAPGRSTSSGLTPGCSFRPAGDYVSYVGVFRGSRS